MFSVLFTIFINFFSLACDPEIGQALKRASELSAEDQARFWELWTGSPKEAMVYLEQNNASTLPTPNGPEIPTKVKPSLPQSLRVEFVGGQFSPDQIDRFNVPAAKALEGFIKDLNANPDVSIKEFLAKRPGKYDDKKLRGAGDTRSFRLNSAYRVIYRFEENGRMIIENVSKTETH